MRGWVAALLVTGCFHPSPPSGAPCSDEGTCPSGLSCVVGVCATGGEAPNDAPSDVASIIDVPIAIDVAPMVDAPPCATFSHQFDTCGLDFSTPIAITSTGLFDTKSGTLLQNGTMTTLGKQVGANAGAVWVISASSFTLAPGVSLRASGPFPLAIAVKGSIDIQGAIDVAGGAGGRYSCAAGAGQAHVGGAGGGGGGGFHGSGGTGGDGDQNTGPSNGGIHGGPMSLPPGPLGGCAGGSGGNGGDTMEGKGGIGGAGGGSVYLVASNQISISTGGSINAGGAGGMGGTMPDGGGGGGGAGGFILIEAPAVNVAGVLAANGGGGGGGGATTVSGVNGQVARVGAIAAQGAAAMSPGGAGANGSVAAALDGASPTTIPLAAGGGGGGGAGFIAIFGSTPTVTGTISPPLSHP